MLKICKEVEKTDSLPDLNLIVGCSLTTIVQEQSVNEAILSYGMCFM